MDVCGAIRDLPWRNILSADNPLKVLNEHLSLIVGRYNVPTKVICVHNQDEPWFDDQFGFKQEAHLRRTSDRSRVYCRIKNYSGVSFEFRQIKAAMGASKQQMLPSFWSDNSTAITGDFKHPIVCDFPAGLASEFYRESPRKNQGCCIVFDYSVATIDCARFNS